MKVITFDVEHGSSHLIRTPSDQVIMIDAGSTENFSPALHILNIWKTKQVRWFTVTHHDADHLTDISNIAEYLQVMTLDSPVLDETQLSELYTEEFSTPLEVFLEYKKQFNRRVPAMSDPSYDWGGVQFATFGNKFTDFENPNINDLSIVTFAHYMGWTFIFPGDLEVAGWKKLLEIPEFCEWLKRVDVFVASHHGRESGFCKEVFTYCAPKIVLMSDKSRSETSCPDKYRPFTQGLPVINAAHETKTRYILTTAKDGLIYISIDPEGRCGIATSA
jgi:beta-lactamase superfamily II metal-dependent hydrolase